MEEVFEGDEFSLRSDDVADLSDEWRLAYVARIVLTLAHAYGIDTSGSRERPRFWGYDPGSLADVVCGINDIVHEIDVTAVSA